MIERLDFKKNALFALQTLAIVAVFWIIAKLCARLPGFLVGFGSQPNLPDVAEIVLQIRGNCCENFD